MGSSKRGRSDHSRYSRHRSRSVERDSRKRSRHSIRRRSRSSSRSTRLRSESRRHRRSSRKEGHRRRRRSRSSSTRCRTKRKKRVEDTQKRSVSSSLSNSTKSEHEIAVKEVEITENKPIEETITKDTPTIETQISKQLESVIVSSESKEMKDLPGQEIKIQCIQSQIEALKKLPRSLASPKAHNKLDVSMLKMDILNVLKEARDTIAGIKNEDTVVPHVESKAEAEVIQSKRTSPINTQTDPESAEKDTMKDASTLMESNPGDDFDMFSLDEQQEIVSSTVPPAKIFAASTCEESNCDDGEGYYRATVGEILNARYRVLGTVGKGVFSTVLRCLDLNATPGEESDTNPSIVAIKLIRNNDTMRNASQTEIKVLKTLGARDPRDRKHCVRLLDHFEHRNHISLVFEPMQMNLREAMKKFGGKSGIAIQAVRVFARHLLIALSHLEACDVVHADVKPDNILLDDKQTTVKVCDFGSAFMQTDGTHHDPTPYLVSRFYRAPEIILGFPYDKAVDMWSIGCCLFEMFTGQVLFPGSTNNEMLKLFMQLKGKLPSKFIKRHRAVYLEQFQMEPHFTEELKFISRELDRVTGKPIIRHLEGMKTRMDLGNILIAAKSSTDKKIHVQELHNLLDKMLMLDPSKRIGVREALAHPFVKK